jgi:predicted N-acyltransferase
VLIRPSVSLRRFSMSRIHLARMPKLVLRVLDGIGEVDREAWNALMDLRAQPFTRWEWLSAMEDSGCANARSGWTPRHLTLWRGKELIAGAPAYVKADSDGDFARDWDIGSSASRAGVRYYPKLCITVPFTPCGGKRILVAPGEDVAACSAALLRGAEELAERDGLGAVQILFSEGDESRALAEYGWALRISHQYHWKNRGEPSMDAYLARMNSKRRSMLKREIAQPAKEGITIRTVRGAEMEADPKRWAKLAHALHEHTVDKLVWGRRWLNQKFYLKAFAAMPESMELVVAERNGREIAGAFNVATPTRLFGRYWGCFEEHPFLHFNVCLYHSIADCLARGIQVMEGGAGGEHKIARGYEPEETYSLHRALDPRLDEALQKHLAAETQERHAAIARFREQSGVFKKGDTNGVES